VDQKARSQHSLLTAVFCEYFLGFKNLPSALVALLLGYTHTHTIMNGKLLMDDGSHIDSIEGVHLL
jgi:hypothetical protein